MKIVILNSFYSPDEPGGAERSVRILAESLFHSGHDVYVICLGRNRMSSELNGVRIERFPISNSYLPIDQDSKKGLEKLFWHARDSYNLSAANALQEFFSKVKPDVLHTNNLSGFSVSVWALAKKLNIPVVHTTRDFYLMCPKTTMMNGANGCNSSCGKCLPFSLPRKMASRSVDHVVGISKFILGKHQSNGLFSGVNSSVIYNSFEAPTTPFRPLGNEIQIGFIGRLVPEKGVELLIDAFQKLSSQGLNAKLFIAGEGKSEYVESLKDRTRDLKVAFLGKVRPDDFFPMLDLTVAPSVWSEPLGRVVIESIGYGKPVVATPVGGMPELFAEGTGLVANGVDVESLVNAIQDVIQMLKNDALAVYSSAIEHAKKFELSAISDSYTSVYKSVMAVHK